MQIKLAILLFVNILCVAIAYSQAKQDNLVTKKTNKTAAAVVDELKQSIEKKGMKIFAEIPHHLEAEKAGESLPFTYVIIFGNPKVGTKLMQCDQAVGYELPLRILIRGTQNGTLISFQDPKEYSKKYDLKMCEGVLEKMSMLLNDLTNQVL